MKIILSRKGFDSGTGKVASPIFPSGELYTLPIPESCPSRHSKRYQDIQAGTHSLGALVHDLTGGKVQPETFAHLDPDLDAASIPRSVNWRPLFGQTGAAEKHLQNQGVNEGDVFVFYGWFRQVELVAERYRYVRGAPDLHVIFGWLQVEQRLSVHFFPGIPAWARDHPHCKEQPYGRLDSIYLSTSSLRIPGREMHQAGAGRFQRFSPGLCLTAPQQSRSVWQLPHWFVPRTPPTGLSYHRDPHRWNPQGDMVWLKSVGRGQEFVLDCQEYPDALSWLCQLLCSC